MKKIWIAIIAVLVLCTGCGTKDDTKTNERNESGNIIKLTFNGVDLIPGEAFDADKIGGAPDIYVIDNCAIETEDTIYTYDELEVTLNKATGKEAIYSIYVFDESITTNEGLAVFDDKSKMESIYGSDYIMENDYIYVYKYDNANLKITIDDDTVSEIEYVLALE